MEKLTTLKNRLTKIGIETEYSANYPWIYIDKINGKRVTELYAANHGFTVGFMSSKLGVGFNFTDINEIFKLIRKYIV